MTDERSNSSEPVVPPGHQAGWWWGWLLLVLVGVASLWFRVELAATAPDLGPADPAAYAAQGRALADGDGLYIRYISSHYHRYDPEIWRMDDHWPPLQGILIAPFVAAMGPTLLAAKLPGLFFGSLGLPLAVAWLTCVIGGRRWAATAAGLLVIADGQVLRASLLPFADLTVATLGCAFVAAVLAARTRPRLYVLAGVLAGLSWYGKGTEILLVGLLPIMAVLSEGRRALHHRELWVGLLVLGLCMSPRVVHDVVRWGEPIHSTQRNVSGFIGLRTWDATHFPPLLGREPAQHSRPVHPPRRPAGATCVGECVALHTRPSAGPA